MSTSAGWDGVLDGIINEEDCQEPNNEIGYPGNCGSSTIGIAYLLSYLVISFLIVINMYIAVILENYSQATEDVQEGLTDDDYDMYYEIWQQFDPDGTQYIRYDQLSEFLDVLEPPLQIHKPNKYKIVSMDIPICKGDLMFCVDILDALTKDFFARKGNPIEETTELGEVQARPDEIGYEPVSSTLWRQREEYCARLIQNAWRKHKQQRLGGPSEESDDPDMDPRVRQTAVLVESDGFVTKNGHRVVIQGRSPSVTSRTADVWSAASRVLPRLRCPTTFPSQQQASLSPDAIAPAPVADGIAAAAAVAAATAAAAAAAAAHIYHEHSDDERWRSCSDCFFSFFDPASTRHQTHRHHRTRIVLDRRNTTADARWYIRPTDNERSPRIAIILAEETDEDNAKPRWKDS